MFENVHSTWQKHEILLRAVTKSDGSPNIGKTSNDARIITLKSKPLAGNRTNYRLHTAKGISVNLQEQDKSSDIEQQPPFGDRKISNIHPQIGEGGLQNQQEHHIILTKYEAVHPTAVSENNSSSGMLII